VNDDNNAWEKEKRIEQAKASKSNWTRHWSTILEQGKRAFKKLEQDTQEARLAKWIGQEINAQDNLNKDTEGTWTRPNCLEF
jgi:hypothetical protein